MRPSPHNLEELASATRDAQRLFASVDASRRTAALRRLAGLLVEREGEILRANQRDCEQAAAADLAAPLVARLTLDSKKLEALGRGLDALATSPDPVGRVLRQTELDENLNLTQVVSPIGVLLVIFESRPDAVVQIGGLAIRSGNGVILKGGREAIESNRTLVSCLRESLEAEGLPADVVQGVEGRESVEGLLSLDGKIDLVIPRGSGALVRSIQASTRIPVLGHADGICMLYLDRSADPEMAARLALDGKCDYPAACNATETLLVHGEFLPRLREVVVPLMEAGVEIRADQESLGHVGEGATLAGPKDGMVEYGALVLAVRTVQNMDEAIEFIHQHGSAHTDAIVSNDEEAAERFLREVDSASVFHNASTRFADGYRFGLGAEVGISTSRIHARGPVGVDGLMTTRWLLRGQGQRVSDYGGEGRRTFRHRHSM